jgi:lipoate-protein ligase A
MFYIDLESTDPFFNLAVDEYLLKNTTNDFLIISVNDRSVITGKHQVAHREMDTRFAYEHSIPLIRRISGGGTVYHDYGNINFSFILNTSEGKQINFRKYTAPVIEFLVSLRIDATFEGKNDLRVHGLKISGNAEHIYRNRVLHHGTLLFSADLGNLKGVLRKDQSNYKTRAVSSNPSSVTNLSKIINDPDISSVSDFRSAMKNWFLMNHSIITEYNLSEKEKEIIGSLADSKYRTWEWNYAYGPEYSFRNRFRAFGTDSYCSFTVKNGIIGQCEASGDQRLIELVPELEGYPHMPDEIMNIFEKKDIKREEIDIFDFF